MSLEIERKFLVETKQYRESSFKVKYVKQGYLNSDKNRAVRVRVIDDAAFLTIKGASNESGTTRFEWEKEISSEEAENLMKLCEPGIIEKNRFYHQVGKHIFEIDEFLGDNEGLVIAEIELSDEKELFEKPNYLGKEVTGEKKFYNASLSKNPFNRWA